MLSTTTPKPVTCNCNLCQQLTQANTARWKALLAEFFGTALLVAGGLTVVIVMFGAGSPIAELLPNLKVRQAITGFLFGSIGATIAISFLGRISGAHINPAVTLVFWLFHKIDPRTATGYIIAQLAGGIVGALPLLLWGEMGRSVSFGATLPGESYSTISALAGEIVTTFAMVSLLILFVAFRSIRSYTPMLFPIIYCIMVPLEAAISGTSTNPARSLGPATISGEWHSWWIYWVGPLTGALLASIACSLLARKITSAKLYHFDGTSDKMFRADDGRERLAASAAKIDNQL
jgi:aquaporin Z